MSFNDDLLRAEAIREVRAGGCTLPGVAELIVEYHGALHILANTSRIQALGEEVAASDTEAGAKMREILQGEAKKVADALETKQIADEQTSKPVESQAAADASAGAMAGSAPDAAVQDEEAAASAAAGNSAASSESAAHDSTASLRGKGRRKDL